MLNFVLRVTHYDAILCICCCLLPLGPVKLTDREYNGTVNSVKLNDDYAAVSFDGRLQLHTVSQLREIQEVIHRILLHTVLPPYLTKLRIQKPQFVTY